MEVIKEVILIIIMRREIAATTTTTKMQLRWLCCATRAVNHWRTLALVPRIPKCCEEAVVVAVADFASTMLQLYSLITGDWLPSTAVRDPGAVAWCTP